MSDRPDTNSPDLQLWACADGELPPNAQADLFRRLAAEPASARVVEDQLRLRGACSRVLSDVEGPSDALARQVAAMAFQMPAARRTNAAPARRPTEFWRIGLAGAVAASAGFVAVGLLVGGIAMPGRKTTPLATGGSSLPVVTAVTAPSNRVISDDQIYVLGANGITPRRSVIPVQYVNTLTRTHVQCSRHLAEHSQAWPPELASLEDPIKAYLGGGQPYPDLSKAGFKYVGCSACAAPDERGRKLVHLVYVGDTPANTISLFIEPYQDQMPLQPGVCYGCGVPDSAHPMLAWKSGDLAFFLVGNGRDSVASVRSALKLPSPQAQ